MEDKKLETVILGRILSLVDGSTPRTENHNWLITVGIWVIVCAGSFFISSRFGSTTGGRALVVAGAFIAGIAVTYAVLNAWQSSLWSHASRYLDVEAMRKRIAEPK
jgi:hypothetical protein